LAVTTGQNKQLVIQAPRSFTPKGAAVQMQESAEGKQQNSQVQMPGKIQPTNKAGSKVFPTDSPTQKYFEQPMVISTSTGSRTVKTGYSPTRNGPPRTTANKAHTQHFSFT
jgi:hypothetical protein